MAMRLPGPKRAESLAKIREEFRRNASEHDSTRIEELLKHANSTLGYLKIVTPKRVTEQAGRTTIVFGDPSRPTKAVSNWTGSNMDPDSVSRHFQSLKRAGFSNNFSVNRGLF